MLLPAPLATALTPRHPQGARPRPPARPRSVWFKQTKLVHTERSPLPRQHLRPPPAAGPTPQTPENWCGHSKTTEEMNRMNDAIETDRARRPDLDVKDSGTDEKRAREEEGPGPIRRCALARKRSNSPIRGLPDPSTKDLEGTGNPAVGCLNPKYQRPGESSSEFISASGPGSCSQ